MKKDLLEAIKNEFWKGHNSADVVIGDHTYTLKTLNNAEEAWRDGFVAPSASLGFLTARKAPTLAVALKAIDGLIVTDLFSEPPTEEVNEVQEMVKQISQNQQGEKFEIAKKVLEFINDLPSDVVDTLYNKYMELENTRKNAIQSYIKKN